MRLTIGENPLVVYTPNGALLCLLILECGCISSYSLFPIILQVLILSEKLHSVTSQFDQLRAIRFQEAINRVTPRRKPKSTTKSNAAEASASSSLDPDMKRDSEVRDSDVSQAAPIRVQEQLLDDETRALQVSGKFADR